MKYLRLHILHMQQLLGHKIHHSRFPMVPVCPSPYPYYICYPMLSMTYKYTCIIWHLLFCIFPAHFLHIMIVIFDKLIVLHDVYMYHCMSLHLQINFWVVYYFDFHCKYKNFSLFKYCGLLRSIQDVWLHRRPKDKQWSLQM